MASRGDDRARADRYSQLAKALRYNPDLKYPNLDKVLPLPPAQLPKWDGNEETLIDAAKGLVATPVVTPTPGSERTGRAHIPDGWILPANPEVPRDELAYFKPMYGVSAQYEQTPVRFSGYWLPQLLEPRDERHAEWDSAQVPQRYARGEVFESVRDSLELSDGRVMWHYKGAPVERPAVAISARVRQGIARYGRIPLPHLNCDGHTVCPRTGVWFGRVRDDHPQAAVYNVLTRQAYVSEGQSFPDPRTLHLSIEPREVRWLWLDQANEIGPAGFANVTLSDLHDTESRSA